MKLAIAFALTVAVVWFALEAISPSVKPVTSPINNALKWKR